MVFYKTFSAKGTLRFWSASVAVLAVFVSVDVVGSFNSSIKQTEEGLEDLCLVTLKTVSSLTIKLQFFILFSEEEAIHPTKPFSIRNTEITEI